MNGCGIIEHSLKNKANLADAQMNVSFFFKKDYEKNRGWTLGGLSAIVNGIIHNEIVKIAAGNVLLLRLIDGSAMYLRS